MFYYKRRQSKHKHAAVIIFSSCLWITVNVFFFSFRFGRKKVVFISLGAQCFSVLLQSFSHSWRMFCIMFLFVGASQISIYISAFVLGMNRKILIKYFVSWTQIDVNRWIVWLSSSSGLPQFYLEQERRCWVRLCECSSQLLGPSFSIASGTWHYLGLHMASENGELCLPFWPQLPWSTSLCGGISLLIDFHMLCINIMCW